MHWRRKWQPTPVFLPGESPGQRSLVGCSPRGREESDTTERLHSHFSLPCIGEGNGNPLQCSCLENPRDGGAWWAAIYGVARSWTRLKRLSSGSSRKPGLLQSMSLQRMGHDLVTKQQHRTVSARSKLSVHVSFLLSSLSRHYSLVCTNQTLGVFSRNLYHCVPC